MNKQNEVDETTSGKVDKAASANWLASFFYYIHAVIEAADKPISLVVMVSLPIVAPLTPAIWTGKSLGKFMDMDRAEVAIAIVSFEFIGYLGMVAVVGALMRVVESKAKVTKTKVSTKSKRGVKIEKTNEEKVLMFNFYFYLLAYIVYLITLVVTNAVLEFKDGASWERVTVILCLTVGMSVAAGILNASRLFNRDKGEEDNVLRQENREDDMERYRIRHGKTEYAADTQLAQNAQKGVQVAQAPRRNFAISGNWRVDEGKLRKKDLEWLRDAPKDAICKEYNLKPRTAYDWKKRATDKLR